MKQKSPKEIMTIFKKILFEAAKVVGRDPSSVNVAQFSMVSNGRLGQQQLQKLGGYGVLKQWAAPSKKASPRIEEALAVLKKVAKYAQK